MKRIFIVVASLFLLGTLSAQQLDRSIRPSAAAAPEIRIKDAKTFTLPNGLKVFLVEDHKLPRVYYSLSLDIKPTLEGSKAGMEGMYNEVFGTATTTKSKEEINKAFDIIGADFSVGSRSGYVMGLKKHEKKMVELFADVLFNPVFKQEELDLQKEKAKSNFAYLESDAGQIARRVSSILCYGKNHPYGEAETLETIGNITISDFQDFYNAYFSPNVARLVIVGDITEKEAKENATKYFSSWKKKQVKQVNYTTPTAPEGIKVAMISKDGLPQSFINFTYPVQLQPGASDLLAAQAANYVYGGGSSSYLFQNLRETHSYTYGVYSGLKSDELVGSFSLHAGRSLGSVKSAVTDSAIYQILLEMRRINDEPISNEMLASIKAAFSGDFARSLQDPATIARFAVSIDKYKLPKDYYKTYLKRVEALTAKDVQAAAKKYIHPNNAWIIVAGDKSHAETLKQFATNNTVQFYDMDGNPIEAPVAKKAAIAPETIISKYVDALGGKAAIEKINDYKITASMDMMGQKMEVSTYFKKPNKTAVTYSMGGAVMQKVAFDGSVLRISGAGGKQEVTEGKELDEMKAQAAVCPEMNYAANGYKMEVKGVEQVNGKDAYVLAVTVGESTSTSYFDVESGLKVKSVSVQDSPQGQIQQATEYLDYKSVEGVQFPFIAKQNAMGMTMEMKVTSVDVNKGISDDSFI